MPFAEISDGQLYYEFDGNPSAPVLMLSNSLGTNISMWQQQVAELSPHFRVLRYDCRGQGRSLVTPGPYRIDQLARDALALLDRLQLPCVHFCGLSMGGMVGMWIAAHEPARVDRLVLANTTALLPSPAAWNARIQSVQTGGIAAIANTVIERWFTPAFRESKPREVEAARRALLESAPTGYIGCVAALRDLDLRLELKSIRARTLVIAGQFDPATPPEMGRTIAQSIDGARFLELPAAHLSNIETSAAFNAAVLHFLLG